MEARTCSTSEIAIFPSDTILYDTTQSIPGPHLLSRPEENVSNFESVNVKYGCPFRKRNPRRFNIREFQSCATNGFGDLPTLKRHIRTYHRRQPQNRCTAGQKEFESAEQPSEYPEMPTNQSRHIKESDDPEDGINDEIDEILAQRKSDLKVASWKGLWQVLFPNDHEILSSEFVPPKTVEIPEVFDIFDAILLHENAANSDTHIQNMNIDPPLQLQPFRTQLLTKLDALCQPNTETKSNNSLNTTSPFMLKSQPENLAISPTPSTASSLDPSSS
ncbi:hypothetical protein F4805DRAFT_414085 [Annulohypoxylon moriforme]|nr:hypothetical protein F4805DRAFT_414085 [Annulohypoxylon moriforme]